MRGGGVLNNNSRELSLKVFIGCANSSNSINSEKIPLHCQKTNGGLLPPIFEFCPNGCLIFALAFKLF